MSEKPLPSAFCPQCLGQEFKVVVVLDPDDYTIGLYTLSGYCHTCGAKVTLPTPKETHV